MPHFLLYQLVCAVHLTQFRLLDLSGRITRNLMENNLLWSLISWKLQTEVLDFFLCAGHAILDLDDRSGLLAQPAVWKSNNCHVLDLVMLAQEILDLYRINILASTDDDILFRSTRK